MASDTYPVQNQEKHPVARNQVLSSNNSILYLPSSNDNAKVVRHSSGTQATHCPVLSIIQLSLTTISIQPPALLVHPQALEISVSDLKSTSSNLTPFKIFPRCVFSTPSPSRRIFVKNVRKKGTGDFFRPHVPLGGSMNPSA